MINKYNNDLITETIKKQKNTTENAIKTNTKLDIKHLNAIIRTLHTHMRKSALHNLPKKTLNRIGFYTPQKVRSYKISKYTQYANKVINDKIEPDISIINKMIKHLHKLNDLDEDNRNNIINNEDNKTKCQTIKNLAEKYLIKSKKEKHANKLLVKIKF